MATDEGKRYGDMAPNLEQVVYTRDTLVMRDNNGNEFAVTAKEGDEVMAFLKAFDEWFHAKEGGRFSAGILDALWNSVRTTFNDLPWALQQDLPSAKLGGVIIKGGGHDHA